MLGSSTVIDARGEISDEIDFGNAPAGTANPPEGKIVLHNTYLGCTAEWVCQVDEVHEWGEGGTMSPTWLQSETLRKSKFTWDPNYPTKPSVVMRWHEGALPLERSHATGATVAPDPTTQSVNGQWIATAVNIYDNYGNLNWSNGPHDTGVSITYDAAFNQFPQLIQLQRTDTAEIQTTRLIYHRGFETVAEVEEATGQKTSVDFDAFGRPWHVARQVPDLLPGSTQVEETYQYSDYRDLPWVRVTGTAGEGVAISNGVGETVLAFQRANTADGDLGAWVVHGWTERGGYGQGLRTARPFFTNDDPVAVATSKAPPVAVGGAMSTLSVSRDLFGRVTSAWAGALQIEAYAYKPLETTVKDAEQLKASGPYAGRYLRTTRDGHGFVRNVHQESPTVGNLDTSAVYLPSGEPRSITRTKVGGSVTRYMRYDSLGRLVENLEPHATRTSPTARGWRYAWDDAGQLVGTSDARGCGKNIFYDGRGRLLAEDYSPCLASHAPYTSPELLTGNGTELFNQYDYYELGQTEADPVFNEDDKYALGALVATKDRGAATRFNFDARGRPRRVSRQVAKPGPADADLSLRYAPHWYKSRTDYDAAGRLARQTTGADVPEVMAGGQSEVSFGYGARGLLRFVGTSYRTLLSSAVYAADSQAVSMTYGDAASTQATFGYDARRRMQTYNLTRAALPTFPTNPHYTAPTSATTQTDLQKLSVTLDDVGNPTSIVDNASTSQWGASLRTSSAPSR